MTDDSVCKVHNRPARVVVLLVSKAGVSLCQGGGSAPNVGEHVSVLLLPLLRKAEVAQLNLVFGIASLSGGDRSSDDLASFESQWKAATDSILTESCMATLQVLVLAQIFCIQQGELTRLLTYKGLATTLSARLGLHQSQKRFALGTLTCETRKKVFWTLYTVDW